MHDAGDKNQLFLGLGGALAVFPLGLTMRHPCLSLQTTSLRAHDDGSNNRTAFNCVKW